MSRYLDRASTQYTLLKRRAKYGYGCLTTMPSGGSYSCVRLAEAAVAAGGDAKAISVAPGEIGAMPQCRGMIIWIELTPENLTGCTLIGAELISSKIAKKVFVVWLKMAALLAWNQSQEWIGQQGLSLHLFNFSNKGAIKY